MPEKDLYDAIRDGDFYPKSSCPRKPVKPRLIGQHTSKEAEIYVEALKEYENDMVNWNVIVRTTLEVDFMWMKANRL